MNKFSDKGTGEKITYSVSFAKLLAKLAAGTTITAQAVTIAVLDSSTTPDTNPNAMLNGAAQLSTDGKTVLQSIIGGMVYCTYVLSFKITLSDLEVLQEDVTLYVTDYVPSGGDCCE